MNLLFRNGQQSTAEKNAMKYNGYLHKKSSGMFSKQNKTKELKHNQQNRFLLFAFFCLFGFRTKNIVKIGKLSRWQKRWWCLDGTHLYYQDSPTATKGKKSFDLGNVAFIREGEDGDSKDDSNVDRIFEVGYFDRTYYLRADTHDAMRKWVVVLNAAHMAIQ